MFHTAWPTRLAAQSFFPQDLQDRLDRRTVLMGRGLLRTAARLSEDPRDSTDRRAYETTLDHDLQGIRVLESLDVAFSTGIALRMDTSHRLRWLWLLHRARRYRYLSGEIAHRSSWSDSVDRSGRAARKQCTGSDENTQTYASVN